MSIPQSISNRLAWDTPCDLPRGGERAGGLKRVYSCVNHVTKGPDGLCRALKLGETIARDLIGKGIWGEHAENFAKVAKTISDVEQPLYRTVFAGDIFLNPKHGSDHWRIFKVTAWFCPAVLFGVSALQLACNAHKLGIIDCPNFERWSGVSQRAGLFGAGVAALFSAQSLTFNFVTEHRCRLRRDELVQDRDAAQDAVTAFNAQRDDAEELLRARGDGIWAEAAGQAPGNHLWDSPSVKAALQADLDGRNAEIAKLEDGIAKLHNEGYNNLIAGLKYTCDALKTVVVLYANSRGLWHLKYAAALLAVGQTAHTVWTTKH
jgi:hypothetical protein